MSIVLDGILVAFLLLIAFGCSYTNHKKQFDDYLDIKPTTALRGILAVEIVLYHMSENAVGGRFFSLLSYLGYLPVPVFFFLSGYGLMYQFKRKGKSYLNGFWKNRILYLFIIYVLTSLVYTIFKFVVGREVTFVSFFKDLVVGKPIATAHWYIIVQLLLYVIFWIAFKLNVNSYKKNIAIVVVLTLLLSLFYVFKGEEIHWYQSNFAFAFGLIWAEEKEKIDGFMKNHFYISLILTAGLTVGSLVMIYGSKYLGFAFEIINPIFRNVLGIAFVAFLCVLLRVVKPTSKYWMFLGKISLEIYLYHSLAWVLLRSNLIYIEDNALWTIATLLLSIAIAIIAHKINLYIAQIVKTGKLKKG